MTNHCEHCVVDFLADLPVCTECEAVNPHMLEPGITYRVHVGLRCVPIMPYFSPPPWISRLPRRAQVRAIAKDIVYGKGVVMLEVSQRKEKARGSSVSILYAVHAQIGQATHAGWVDATALLGCGIEAV